MTAKNSDEGVYEIPLPYQSKSRIRESLGSDDFVDVDALDNWNKKRNIGSFDDQQNHVTHDVKIRVTVERSYTSRPLIRPPAIVKLNSKGNIHRSISFASPIKPQVDKNLPLPSAGSRWSTDSSDNSNLEIKIETNPTSKNDNELQTLSAAPRVSYKTKRSPANKLRFHKTREKLKDTSDTSVSVETRIRKSYSLHDTAKMPRRSRDLDKMRRRSMDDGNIRPVCLRDSTIDLVSDDENSDAYAAVSLAGTLSRNRKTQFMKSSQKRRKYCAIAGVFVVFIIVIIVLTLVLVLKK